MQRGGDSAARGGCQPAAGDPRRSREVFPSQSEGSATGQPGLESRRARSAERGRRRTRAAGGGWAPGRSADALPRPGRERGAGRTRSGAERSAGGVRGRSGRGAARSRGPGGGPYRQPQGLQHLPLVFVPRSDVPPGEVVVPGQEALQKAGGPGPAAVPAAATVVAAPLRPARPRASRRAPAARGSAAQAQPPGPGARLHGRGRSLLPRTSGVGGALGPSSGRGPPGGGCLRPGVPFPEDDRRDRWMDGWTDGWAGGCCGAMNRHRAQPGHALKVAAPLEAPAPHTLSGALGAGGGMGPANARPMGVNGG